MQKKSVQIVQGGEKTVKTIETGYEAVKNDGNGQNNDKNSQNGDCNYVAALADVLKKKKEICAIRDIDKAVKPQRH